jgi:glycosyltransferase involved in cell wall biosynthesis
MRILVLTKRHTSGKDLLKDHYGRVYELARGLAQHKHEVHGLAIDYWAGKRNSTSKTRNLAQGINPIWQSVALQRYFPWVTVREVTEYVMQVNPEVLFCSGDALQIILGVRVARRLGLPVITDLYDNYEAFALTRIPGVKQAYRRAVRSADRVTCVSDPLAEHIREMYQRLGPVSVLPNGVRPEQFPALGQPAARKEFALPAGIPIIGTAGSLRRRRGISTLVEAFHQLREQVPEARLVLAGEPDRHASPSSGEGIEYLGRLPHEKMATFYRALDVGVICNRDTRFGRYCYPLKLNELIATGIPFVAARVGVTGTLLEDYPECLYPVDDAAALADRLARHLHSPHVPDLPFHSWDTLSQQLLGEIKAAIIVQEDT